MLCKRLKEKVGNPQISDNVISQLLAVGIDNAAAWWDH